MTRHHPPHGPPHAAPVAATPAAVTPAAPPVEPPAPITFPRHDAELRYDGASVHLSGRALQLILWLATRQTRINTLAPERGQAWITWKGDGLSSIDGEILTRL